MQDMTEGTLHGTQYRLVDSRLYAVVMEEGNMRAVAQYFNDRSSKPAWRLVDITLEYRQKTAMQDPFWERQGAPFRTDDTMSLDTRERWLFFVLMNRADAFLKSFVAQR